MRGVSSLVGREPAVLGARGSTGGGVGADVREPQTQAVTQHSRQKPLITPRAVASSTMGASGGGKWGGARAGGGSGGGGGRSG